MTEQEAARLGVAARIDTLYDELLHDPFISKERASAILSELAELETYGGSNATEQ